MRHELDAILAFEGGDIGFAEPDRNLDCDRDAVIGEHEALEL